MKRFLSLLMALILVLSLCVTGVAEEVPPSITITNATIGQTYYLYKFFDASYAVDKDGNTKVDANGKAIVAYTIQTSNQFFDDMFGADGTAENAYFTYNKDTGAIGKKDGVLESDIIDYLDTLANSEGVVYDQKITATSDTVVFDGISTGYYLIDRGLTSTVTVTSNVPVVKVIDKNQKPNVDDSFSKLVWDEDAREWVSSSSANVGDIIDWKLNFVATNYDGDEKVLYYAIRDNKSSSLWVEFNSIAVAVNGEDLGKGYYWCAGDPSINTLDWTAQNAPEQWAATPEEAAWYLIHYTYDEFEIVIPWLDDYTFTGVQSTTKGYELEFDLSETDNNRVLSESLYDSPAEVEVTYSAAVGPGAANIVSTNSATLDWITPEGPFGPDVPETTETKVYNLGITKTANDGTATTAATRLAGAIFEIYRDEECTQPVFVIPTKDNGVDGVYILDDLKTEISGTNYTTSRERYAGEWEEYIGVDTTKQRADMETPASGQLVIMGLEAGTYYLKETKAPEGYNRLKAVEKIVVGTGDTATYSNNYTDRDGNAVTYTVYNATIVNNTGAELPATGGEGTTMLITAGTLVVMVFAVLLITHKKMTIYQD